MIKLVQGFDIGSPLPIDGRILLSKEEMYRIDDNILPEKYFAICKEDGRLYLYNKTNVTIPEVGKFRLADDTVDERITEEVDTLNERIDTEVDTLNDRIDSEVADLNAEDSRLDSKIDNYKTTNQLVSVPELTETLTRYPLRVNTGRFLHIDKSHYTDSEGQGEFRFTVQLMNDANELISTSEEIDLPLESVVVSGSYDSATKEVVLELQDGSEIRFSVADLISGLVSDTTFSNHVNNVSESVKHVTATELNLINSAVQPAALQDYLVAGNNVTLTTSGNQTTVSAKDTTYSALPDGGIVINDQNQISTTSSAPYWDLIQSEFQKDSEGHIIYDSEGNPIVIGRGPDSNVQLKQVFDTKLDLDTYEEDQTSLETTLDNMSDSISDNATAITNVDDRVAVIENIVVNSEGNRLDELQGEIDTLQISKQNVITQENKLSSDLVSDSGATHLFVTATEKSTWNNKQNALTNQTAYTGKGTASKVPQITTNELGQVTYITEVDIAHPTIGNANLVLQKNGSQVGTFPANATSDVTLNVTVPTTVGELTNDEQFQTYTQVYTSITSHNESSTAHNDIRQAVSTNATDISEIEALIPTEATTSNQLADKAFVNSSIATNTATFRGTYETVANLPTPQQVPSLKDNDYAFVIVADSQGNPEYARYKYVSTNNPTWGFEYTLNNSSFTAEQWAAINSGISSALIPSGATSTNKFATASDIAGLSTSVSTKQDTLVSGTNIKTVNNSTLLGSGNVNVGTVTRIQVAQGDDSSTNKVVIGGSNDITTSGTVKLSHATSGVTAGSYGPSADSSLNPGGSFNVPYVTVDSTGHTTVASTKTVTIPGLASGYGLSNLTGGVGIKSVTITVPYEASSETGAGWVASTLGSDTIYTNTITDSVNLAHITVNSNPVIDVVTSNATTLTEVSSLIEDWSKVYRADTGTNQIILYASDLIQQDLTIIIKG